MKPLLSVVTGTWNRLDYLRSMLKSVRDQMPHDFPYEFVIVDGNSSDGTPAWCMTQPDVVFIQQGALLGAIRAFDAGCEAARGDFVLIANDDVLFHHGSIVRALEHLYHTPSCGAVAFMDNRRAPGYDTDAFKVQTIRAIKDGRYVDVVYAQVGLFRRTLGSLAGWWGSRDIQMGDTHTYGGDAYLSARLWEMGYTVDAVEGVQCTDRVAPDGLRDRNHAIEQQIGSAYYRRYPQGVPVGAPATEPAPEALRILYLPLFSPGYGRYKTGLYDALSKVGIVYELDYNQHRAQLATVVHMFQPHLVISQFHDTNAVDASVLSHLRSLAPGAVWVNWMGDVWMEALIAPGMLELLKHIDLQLVVNAEVLPFYAERGIQAAYWQIAAEPVPDELPEMPSHDIVFLANAYSPSRKELGSVLQSLSKNVGLYGWGWEDENKNTFYDFAKGASLYRNCKIAIGDNMYNDKGFVSNRLFEALANGAFLLHQVIPGLEELTGLVDGVHYISWTDYEDLRAKVRGYLKNDVLRGQIAANGERFVREAHSFDARVKELFEDLLPRIADGQSTHDRVETVAAMAVVEPFADGIPR